MAAAAVKKLVVLSPLQQAFHGAGKIVTLGRRATPRDDLCWTTHVYFLVLTGAARRGAATK